MEKEDSDSTDECDSNQLTSSSQSYNSQVSSEICENPSFYHLKILKKYFGHSNFRPMQWKIISSVLKDKRDNCAVMTTGYGKSLCYQYPAIYSGGITLVVSPLISLMEDQVYSLKVSNISACLLGTAQKEKSKILEQIFEKKYSIIYVTPEFVTGDYGIELLKKMKQKLDICLVAVDEAHCISSWGHDFRHQYRHLGKVRDLLPNVPVLAVTATATQRVEKDIIKSLRLKNPQVSHSGFDRPNLYLEVVHKSQQGPTYDFLKVLDQVYGSWKFPGPTIIYCLTRKMTDTIAELLKIKGITCASYHAGKSLKERKEIHEKFLKDQFDAIIATSAFGMGIDKPDIRCIVHYGTPSSIEAYYQEIGRAGRDGERSRCVLFFNEGDFQTHRLISQKNHNSYGGSSNEEEMSNKVRKYLHSTTECRRTFILSYFGEKYTGTNDHCCDICYIQRSGKQQNYEGVDTDGNYDFTNDAEKILKTISILGGRYGLNTYILFIRGSKVSKIKEEYKEHPLHGCGKNKTENWWKGVGQMLVQENFIMRKAFHIKGFATHLLDLTPKGEKFLETLADGKYVKLMLKPPVNILEQLKQKKQIQVHNYTTGGKAESGSKAILIQNTVKRNKEEELDKKLYSLLLEKRYQIADVKDCMPHYIISIPDIKEFIKVKPRTMKELEKCKFEMFSEFKILQFGQELINVIVGELGPVASVDSGDVKKTMVEALLTNPLPGKTSASAEISYNLMKQGQSIQEISEQRGMAPSTIFSHLLDSMKRGLPITLESMGVDKSSRLVIVRAILETPGSLLTPIKEKCPPEITWDQIRTVLTYMKVRDHLEENQMEYEEFEEFTYESLKSDAGSLDLASSQKKINQLECNPSTSSTTNVSSTKVKSSEVEISKEDHELDEFLKICEDLIHEDELSLKETEKFKNHKHSQKRDNSSIEDCNNINHSPPDSPKVYATLNNASCMTVNRKHIRDSSDEQEWDNIMNICGDMIDKKESNTRQNQQTVITTASVDMNSSSNSDDDIFKSPPRRDFDMDYSVPFKVPRLE